MPRTDTAARVVAAAPQDGYDALVDREALAAWLPPSGMTAGFEAFDLRPGGSFRMVPTCVDPSAGQGKATADSDVVEARFVELHPGRRASWAVEFVSDDPAFAGTMTMTWDLDPVDGGTRVAITATDVPDGIAPEDHAAGMASSLDDLARHLER